MHRRLLLASTSLCFPMSRSMAQTPQVAVEDAPKKAMGPVAIKHPSLHLVGDSTMADKSLNRGHPERGWGQLLRARMKEPQRLLNHAVNGRSGRSFRAEGRWDHLLGQLAPGDYVLIQFGHNDQKAEDPKRYAKADTDYRLQLRRFVSEVRERGAEALLATSVLRRKFDASGQVVDTLGDYPRVTREVAAEMRVPLLDLHRDTRPWLERLGPEDSKRMFMWLEPGVYVTVPQGRQDDTHFVEAGAQAVAALAIEELRRLQHALADWFT